MGGEARGRIDEVVAAPPSSMRERVLDAVLARGPVTASQLGAQLGMTPAGVRRHLDALGAAGLVGAPRVATQTRAGRPARAWVATQAGHRSAGSAYDVLAVDALQALLSEGGDAAVGRFAARRARDLEERYAGVVAAGASPAERVSALAGALDADGYAATADRVPRSGATLQLCQGHCPVHAVAERFPQLCDAEEKAFARLLGTPVRRLATIAAGSHACTTSVSVVQQTTSPQTTTPETIEPTGMDQLR